MKKTTLYLICNITTLKPILTSDKQTIQVNIVHIKEMQSIYNERTQINFEKTIELNVQEPFKNKKISFWVDPSNRKPNKYRENKTDNDQQPQ